METIEIQTEKQLKLKRKPFEPQDENIEAQYNNNMFSYMGTEKTVESQRNGY